MREDERTSAEMTERIDDALERLFRDGRINALLAWLFVVILVTVLVESVFDADVLWVVFVTATGVVVLVAPIAHRDWRVMLPWELLLLGLFPILVRGLFGGEVGTFATYLSLAALALFITVELHMFTALRMTHWFAVVFVVLVTLASAAAWAIVRWNFDRYLGTSFLVDNETLMIEFIYVALAGLAAGVLFDAYFKRRGRRLRRAVRRRVSRR